MTNDTTRRALLGGAGLATAALIAPAVAALPTTSTPDRAAWDAAFARWTASGAAAKAAGWPDPLTDAYHDNWAKLMSTPAPDVRALHWKLHELFSELDPDGYSGSWGGAITAAVLADATRLANAEGR